jgi:hypothetical protein
MQTIGVKVGSSEAIIVYIFFGRERHPSGSLFIPDSPYFLGLFLCEKDTIKQALRGTLSSHQRPFICVARPQRGTTFRLLRSSSGFSAKNRCPTSAASGSPSTLPM